MIQLYSHFPGYMNICFCLCLSQVGALTAYALTNKNAFTFRQLKQLSNVSFILQVLWTVFALDNCIQRMYIIVTLLTPLLMLLSRVLTLLSRLLGVCTCFWVAYSLEQTRIISLEIVDQLWKTQTIVIKFEENYVQRASITDFYVDDNTVRLVCM